jgi:hypothetical protein
VNDDECGNDAAEEAGVVPVPALEDDMPVEYVEEEEDC